MTDHINWELTDADKIDEPQPLPGLTVGRMVHYCMSTSMPHRAAVVTDVFDPVEGIVSLFVMGQSATYHKRDIHYSAVPGDETWHWIEPK